MKQGAVFSEILGYRLQVLKSKIAAMKISGNFFLKTSDIFWDTAPFK